MTGESYAGHYIPVVTHHIWHTNKAKPESERINLAGMAIGNGMCVRCLDSWLRFNVDECCSIFLPGFCWRPACTCSCTLY